MKSFLPKIGAAVLLLTILGPLGTPLVQAQAVPQPAIFNPPNQGSSKRNQDILRKWREQDQQQCEAEAKNKNQTLGQAIGKGASKSLKKAINDKVGANILPLALHNTTVGTAANSAASRIQTNLRQEIKTGFSTRWGEEFPKALARNMEAQNRLGYTADYLRENQGQFKKLIDDSVREAWPQVMNRDFIGRSVVNSWKKDFESTLGDNLKLEFGRTAKPTIEEYYRVQIDTMFQQIPDMVKEQLEDLQGTIQGTQAGLQALFKQLQECPGNLLGCVIPRVVGTLVSGDLSQLLPEMKEAEILLKNLAEQIAGIGEFLDWLKDISGKKEEMVQQMLDGISLQLEQSMTDPKNIKRLTDAVLRAVEDPVNDSFDEAINKISDSIFDPTEALVDSIDTLDEAFLEQVTSAMDQQLNIAVATLTGPISATIDTLGNTIADTIDNTIGNTFYSLADGFTGTATEAGNFMADAITNAGNKVWGAAYPFPPPALEVVKDNYQGELAPNQMYESNYYVALENGVKLSAEGGVKGAMSYEDYQAAFPEGAPLEGALDGVSSDAEKGVEEAMPGIAENTVNNQTPAGGLSSSVAQGLKGGFTGILASGAGSIVRGIPFIGPLAAPVVEKLINQAMAGAGAAAPAAGFPVMDVGAIIPLKAILLVNQGVQSNTGETAKTVKQNLELSEKSTILEIQMCTYLKAMQRIQLLAEEKSLIWDADAKKAQALAIWRDYLEVLRQKFNTGVPASPGMTGVPEVPGQENGQPVVPANPSEYVESRAKEAGAAHLAELENLVKEEPEKYGYLAAVIESIKQEEQTDEFSSPYTPEEIENFKEYGNTKGEGYDYNVDEMYEFLSSPYGNPLLARIKVQESKLAAEMRAAGEAKGELDRGDGFLGIYDCPEDERVYYGTGDSSTWYCKNYITKTPPGAVRDTAVAALTSPVRQVEQGDNVESLKKDLPYAAERATNYREYLAKDRAPSVFDGPDPCPGPGPCADTGWQKIRGGAPTPARSNFQPPRTTTSVKSTVSLGDLIQPIIDATLNFSVNTVSLAAVNAGAANTSTLSWNIGEAESCETGSDWLSGGEVALSRNSPLPLSGTRLIAHPLEAAFRLERVEGEETDLLLSLVTTLPSLLAKQWYFSPGTVTSANATYRLTLFGAGEEEKIEVGGASSNPEKTKARVIELLRDNIEAAKNQDSGLGRALSRYNFVYGTSGAAPFISATPKLTYSLRCTRENDQRVAKEITITR